MQKSTQLLIHLYIFQNQPSFAKFNWLQGSINLFRFGLICVIKIESTQLTTKSLIHLQYKFTFYRDLNI